MDDDFKDFHNHQRSNDSIFNESREDLHARQPPTDNPFLDPSAAHNQLRRRSDVKFASQTVQAQEVTLPPTLSTVLNYRPKVLYILLIYIPLLLAPWILTCVLANAPFGYSSYLKQRGQISPDVLATAHAWMVVVRMLNSIAAVVTIPVLSAILAQAAVVYTQRRSLQQNISMRQTLALADRSWQDWILLGKTGLGMSTVGRGASSLFLWLAAGALLISVIQLPLQQLLVSNVAQRVVTCLDNPIGHGTSRPSCDGRKNMLVGWDPEPADLALTPQTLVIDDIVSKLATADLFGYQPHLWVERNDTYTRLHGSTRSNLNQIFQGVPFFVTGFPNNTLTGVLRQHVMRMSYATECVPVARTSFPTTCSGPAPFAVNFNPGSYNIRVCAPGDHASPLFTISRDRQDVSEELFIDLSLAAGTSSRYYNSGDRIDATWHCNANSTRGYFQLGNYVNKGVHGGLLNTWTTPARLADHFNDYVVDRSRVSSPRLPTSWDPRVSLNNISWNEPLDPFNTSAIYTPGPLMTAALALFGPRSFVNATAGVDEASLSTARSQICQKGAIPFSNMYSMNFENTTSALCDRSTWGQSTANSDAEHPLLEMLFQWTTSLFSDSVSAQTALGTAMFFGVESHLTRTAYATAQDSARAISTSRGTAISRPYISTAGMGIISTLIVWQLAALVVLTLYIYRGPTWTASLDALAIARIAALTEKRHDVLLTSEDDRATLKRLEGVDGLVDVALGDYNVERRGSKAAGFRNRGIPGGSGLGLKAWKSGKNVVRDDDDIPLKDRDARARH